MKTVPLKLVTIVAEEILEERLVNDLRQLGATGFTVSEAHGEGTRHLRSGEIPGSNVRVEAIVDAETADRIVEYMAAHYFPHYGIIAFLTDVAVVRGDKYLRAR